MDGSSAAIYLYEPEQEYAVNKILIMFEDVFEGWCTRESLSSSIERCHRYLVEDNLKDYGSSEAYAGS